MAEHHYLVTMIAWLLCEYVNDGGRLLNTEEVIRMSLVHDLGEIFGGDMAAPLSRKRPDMKTHAKAIEDANMHILTTWLSESMREQFLRLQKAAEDKTTDEAWVAKLADMMETHYFLEHRSIQIEQKTYFYVNHIRPLADKVQNPQVRARLHDFLAGFEEFVKDRGFIAGNFIIES